MLALSESSISLRNFHQLLSGQTPKICEWTQGKFLSELGRPAAWLQRLVIGLLRSPIRANREMRKAPPSRTLTDDYPLGQLRA